VLVQGPGTKGTAKIIDVVVYQHWITEVINPLTHLVERHICTRCMLSATTVDILIRQFIHHRTTWEGLYRKVFIRLNLGFNYTFCETYLGLNELPFPYFFPFFFKIPVGWC